MSLEAKLIELFRRRLANQPSLSLPIGDDAAAVRWASGDCVITVDTISDGVDFHLVDTEPHRIGHKALAVNLSDLAAMAAEPVAAVIALSVPADVALELIDGIYDGLIQLAKDFNVSLAGGDVNVFDGPMTISVTAIGRATPAGLHTRNGANVGDEIVVTGPLGGSIRGKHLDFQPRVCEALWLAEHAQVNAAIDISDGLSLDLWRMCEVSRCGAELIEGEIPIAPAAHDMNDGRSPLEHALSDGEDFELLLAMPAGECERLAEQANEPIELFRIGKFVDEKSLSLIGSDGQCRKIEPTGYEHGQS